MLSFSNKYKIIDFTYKDKYSNVYTAINKEKDRKVILKRIDTSKCKNSFLKNLESNIEDLKSIESKNVIKIYDIVESNNNNTKYYYIELEYVDGESIENLLKISNFDVSQALEITKQTIYGLTEFHNRNIVYKYLSTKNIFIDINGIVKLDILGFLEEEKVCIKYISPEQAIDGYIKKYSDIYSLGLIFYELIMGMLPFNYEYGKKELYNSMAEGICIDDNLNLNKNIVHILEKALSIRPLDRYNTLYEFLEDINAYIDYGVVISKKVKRENDKSSKEEPEEKISKKILPKFKTSTLACASMIVLLGASIYAINLNKNKSYINKDEKVLDSETSNKQNKDNLNSDKINKIESELNKNNELSDTNSNLDRTEKLNIGTSKPNTSVEGTVSTSKPNSSTGGSGKPSKPDNSTGGTTGGSGKPSKPDNSTGEDVGGNGKPSKPDDSSGETEGGNKPPVEGENPSNSDTDNGGADGDSDND